MNLALRTAALAVPFVGVLALGLAAVDTPPADAAASRCSVEVLIHEDDSYSKLALYLDGHKMSHAWDVTPPARQNTVTLRRTPRGNLERVANVDWTGAGPVFHGQVCSVVPVRGR